jgi:hypothetical protein
MINKRLSLILLAIVVVIEVVTLIFMRGDYRSVMTTGAEYKVPAQIQFKGDFYNKNYLGITIPITEAPWEGSAPAHRGEEMAHFLFLHRKKQFFAADLGKEQA